MNRGFVFTWIHFNTTIFVYFRWVPTNEQIMSKGGNKLILYPIRFVATILDATSLDIFAERRFRLSLIVNDNNISLVPLLYNSEPRHISATSKSISVIALLLPSEGKSRDKSRSFQWTLWTDRFSSNKTSWSINLAAFLDVSVTSSCLHLCNTDATWVSLTISILSKSTKC